MKNWFKALVGSIAAFLWLVAFSSGLLISSKPWIEKLKSGFDLSSFGIAVGTYTPTNIVFLTCLASLVGGCASNLFYTSPKSHADGNGAAVAPEAAAFLTENPAASMLRGFAVYLAFLAGVYISSDQPFDNVGPNQYARVAGTMSGVAFAVGYDPTMFRRFLGRFAPKDQQSAAAPAGRPDGSQ